MLLHIVQEQEKIVMDLCQDDILALLLGVRDSYDLLQLCELNVGDALHLLFHGELMLLRLVNHLPHNPQLLFTILDKGVQLPDVLIRELALVARGINNELYFWFFHHAQLSFGFIQSARGVVASLQSLELFSSPRLPLRLCHRPSFGLGFFCTLHWAER